MFNGSRSMLIAKAIPALREAGNECCNFGIVDRSLRLWGSALSDNMTSSKGHSYLNILASRKGGSIGLSMAYERLMESMAAELGYGQHTGLPCPRCSNHTPDRALSILVDNRSIKAICHRASCGFVFSNDHVASAPVLSSRIRPYTGAMYQLTDVELEWFNSRFNLPMDMVYQFRRSNGRYMIPIVDTTGWRRGWISRKPWEGSPLWDADDQSSKCLTYMDNEDPVQSWYRGISSDVVLVEDQISAMRLVADTNYSACAILGTGLNEEKVAELQRHTRNILIALDADATGQAFSMARKWGQAFRSCRVVILRKDIKDDTVANVKAIFSPIGVTQ